MFAVQGSAKVVILSAWLIWLVVVIAFLIILEYAHNSIERQLSLGSMSSEELHDYYEGRGGRTGRLNAEAKDGGDR